MEPSHTLSGLDAFTIYAALYWYSAENHGGQGTQLYRLHSKVARLYRPGALECSVDDVCDSGVSDVHAMLSDGTLRAWDALTRTILSCVVS